MHWTITLYQRKIKNESGIRSSRGSWSRFLLSIQPENTPAPQLHPQFEGIYTGPLRCTNKQAESDHPESPDRDSSWAHNPQDTPIPQNHPQSSEGSAMDYYVVPTINKTLELNHIIQSVLIEISHEHTIRKYPNSPKSPPKFGGGVHWTITPYRQKIKNESGIEPARASGSKFLMGRQPG